ncbi:MAG: hypothetical protein JGK17_32435 [Microcoleus sp. PH2017_10_PVI_O_A]|uniref:hypothetical protein n=1 Tax=Microcoleus sp. PH2017_10_PVI_O_A TaxID=2798821 RepID=UPI001D4BD982|nr:hypothetical protein [Microcoleus sp. PH2017_10_PVI_O_A]MCC3410157.1 hypothetical protein [Microcoleus sp. PH2017_10_PVI_O_A]
MTLRNPPTEPQISLRGLSVITRPGGSNGTVTIDANTAIPLGRAAAIRWIDGNNVYANFPFSVVSGTLCQIDALYNTLLVGKYMNQFFALPDRSKIYYRSQNNGIWIAWAALV